MKPYILITGGAGFIGTNLAHHFLAQGFSVMIYDSLARPGVVNNLYWLRQQFTERLLIQIADMGDKERLQQAVVDSEAVFHFAAQVAVTTSLLDPVYDFEVNTQGTLNLLETMRQNNPQAPFVFTSTNKVYGALDNLPLTQNDKGYYLLGVEPCASGIDEKQGLEFHSPYGCSKGAADQYVLDYVRVFGLRATVFRMSCIYGPHQFGTEDQGWVAHSLIRTLQNQAITIYGDGKQVRDLLFIKDLVRAFEVAYNRIDTLAGEAFNIGGGPNNAVSLLEVLSMIEAIHGQPPRVNFADWRPGDQRYYVSDISKFEAATKWQPQVAVPNGLQQLYRWLDEAGKTAQPTGIGVHINGADK
jgi:CDP-paratose 2-epimerase